MMFAGNDTVPEVHELYRVPPDALDGCRGLHEEIAQFTVCCRDLLIDCQVQCTSDWALLPKHGLQFWHGDVS